MFTVFVRNFWKKNPAYPGGREPNLSARKTKIATADTEDEARRIAREWNASHDPGPLSRKAEYCKGRP